MSSLPTVPTHPAHQLSRQHIDKPLRVYVYSYDFECVRLTSNPFSLPHSNPVPSGKLSWSQIGSGAARACLVVCSGRSCVPTEFSYGSYSPHSFGLLHRIPPLPDDRQPGTLPSELQDSTGFEEYEDMLYVPVDATSDQLDLEFHTDT